MEMEFSACIACCYPLDYKFEFRIAIKDTTSPLASGNWPILEFFTKITIKLYYALEKPAVALLSSLKIY